MEIKTINKQGVSKISATLSVRYNILEEDGKTKEINGYIERENASLGTVSLYPDGRVILYCEAGLTDKEKKGVLCTAVDDAAKVYSEAGKTRAE